jgi:hypothetical protein
MQSFLHFRKKGGGAGADWGGGGGGWTQAERRHQSTIEYQVIPSWRDVTQDSVLCAFSKRSALDQGKWCGPPGKAAWTVHHVQNLRQLTMRAAVLGQPSRIRPHLTQDT